MKNEGVSKDRTGEKNINTQGLKMWIKNYKNNKDVDVEFEDGFISYHKTFIDFKHGKIHNMNFKRAYTVESPVFNDRTGEEKINTQNLKMWIEEYRGCNDIDIRFEDGYLVKNKRYKDFTQGSIYNKNFKQAGHEHVNLIDRTGETNINKNGSIMTIIVYNEVHDIIVQFENGYKTKSRYQQFKTGGVNNPYDKTYYGVGYIGEGEYKISNNKKHTKEYRAWKGMLSRCYNPKEKIANISYEGVTVCDEWLCFQKFAKWYKENYYEIKGQRMHLDKDILVKGNKIYSPDNCCIVPERINILFVKNKRKRGDYPIGVHYDKRIDMFVAGYNLFKESIRIGYYNDPIDAFYKGYKLAKEKLIKEVAEYYKNQIPEQVYNAMMNYIVEITD